MMFQRVKEIWHDLDLSYEKFKRPGETKKDYLKRITDYDRGNKLPLIISKLEEEMSSSQEILEEARPIVSLMSLVSNNLVLILSRDFESFRQVIQDIHNNISSKIRDISLADFSFSFKLPVVMDPPLLVVTHKTTGTVVFNRSNYTDVVAPLPMPLQSMIGFAGVGSAVEFKQHFSGKELDPYLKFIMEHLSHFMSGEASKEILFVPKGSYRKTPSGYNFYVNGSTYKASFVEEHKDYTLCKYESVNLVLVPHDRSN